MKTILDYSLISPSIKLKSIPNYISILGRLGGIKQEPPHMISDVHPGGTNSNRPSTSKTTHCPIWKMKLVTTKFKRPHMY